jgi:site-specific DNA-methyltransferase (adenine-specific)
MTTAVQDDRGDGRPQLTVRGCLANGRQDSPEADRGFRAVAGRLEALAGKAGFNTGDLTMRQTLHVPAEVRPADDLAELAAAANAAHDGVEAADRDRLANALKAGDALARAKALCARECRAWSAWVEDNLRFSRREADRYIKVYKHRRKLGESPNFGLEKAEEIAEEAEREEAEEAEEASLDAQLAALPADAFRPDVRHCSMQELLPKLTGVDAIISDPPYAREFLPLYGELARQSARPGLLAEQGIVAVMCGQSHLLQILSAMSEHLPYRWTMSYLTPGGQAVQVWPPKINTFWKPVLVFGVAADWLGDVAQSEVNDNDKRFHHWGQSESGMLDLVKRLTKPGNLVCDPFLGAGTTGVVCIASGRRFVGCDLDAACVQKAARRMKLERARATP